MLNEWSDRVPEPPPRSRWRRVEFWVGLFATLAAAALLLNLVQCVRSLF